MHGVQSVTFVRESDTQFLGYSLDTCIIFSIIYMYSLIFKYQKRSSEAVDFFHNFIIDYTIGFIIDYTTITS